MTTDEPRALSAALSSPAFVTKGGGLAMHVANRHVSRWAPEVGEPGANRIRPLRNLGFVDRLVSPWIEAAQRSPLLRMFSQSPSGVGERAANNVSWVFPRPWYQDELDWMAAARAVNTHMPAAQGASPQMLTTRGTYVAPAQQIRDSQIALPSALYEYIAPSLSIARPDTNGVSDAYSPLVPLGATHAAQVMSRAMAPIMAQPSVTNPGAAARMSPGLRAVLTTMLARSSQPIAEQAPSRVSTLAPELVTPPSPRAESPASSSSESYDQVTQATQVAEQYAEQRARISELQRVARVAAERELVAREQTTQTTQTTQATQSSTSVDARVAEARAVEARQADVQQRANEVAAQRSTVARRDAVDADRARTEERVRIEERIAQRVATQQEAQRLHASARDAAARDARVAPTQVVTETPRAPQDFARAPESRIAAEMAAAISSLPPELASMVAGSIGRRPERAAEAIAELSDALRAVELIARNTAAGGTFESTRGPRLVMPTGLGGLVATLDRTEPGIAQARGAATRKPTMAVLPPAGMAAPRAIRSEMRVPAMAFLASPGAASNAVSPASALGAAASMPPAALSHVAWSDRWLARFAGAKATSLDTLSAMSASPERRLEMLASAAPHAVFVAPFSETTPVEPVAFADGTPIARPGSVASDVLPTLRNAQPAQPALLIADDAETPDDVLFAIATGSQMQRRPMAPAAGTPPSTAPFAATSPSFERETLADLVAHAAPGAPGGAGLAAGLASSPFAPALRHMLPLGVAPTFDVRALFGGGLGATYLAGLLTASTDELTTPAAALPSWAAWSESVGATALGGFAEQPMRDVAGFEPTYVAPEHRSDTEISEAAQVHAAATAEHVTTLRSALLSWDVETTHGAAAGDARMSSAMSAATITPGPTLARSMIEMMSLPMLGGSGAVGDLNGIDLAGMHMQASSYAAPGMVAERALGWSIAQERSTADLAFDFVTPELVLAARVYGLGPAEAAQAARLAIAGPGQLSAMAGAVDRTFVQALAIDAERRGGGHRALTTAFPMVSGDVAVASSSRAASRGEAAGATGELEGAPSRSLFGVERRAPRGAFLWPAATTAALGLNAAAPDGELSMSVVALELLAAQAVAELGTYAALGDHRFTIGADGVVSAASSSFEGGAAAAADAPEGDILASAEAMVPQARREKFHALYLAMSESTQGRSSPAARAARALAIASRGEETLSARERASIAWDVLPVVHAGPGLEAGGDASANANLSTGDVVIRNQRRRDELRALDPVLVDGRPGLGTLSSRAGEALGSYVAPSASSSSSSSSSSQTTREQGAMMRAPTAAQEMIQTGRPSGRHGGGEVEIPAWFEEAARRMLVERSSVSEGISLGELTLVQAAAPQQIAASSRHEGGSTTPVAPAASGAAGAEKEKVDIEKLANDVYREIVILMDIARARNGEPYL